MTKVIGIQAKTKAKLGRYGRSYESYDAIIQRLMQYTKLRPYRTNTRTEGDTHGRMEKD